MAFLWTKNIIDHVDLLPDYKFSSTFHSINIEFNYSNLVFNLEQNNPDFKEQISENIMNIQRLCLRRWMWFPKEDLDKFLEQYKCQYNKYTTLKRDRTHLKVCMFVTKK